MLVVIGLSVRIKLVEAMLDGASVPVLAATAGVNPRSLQRWGQDAGVCLRSGGSHRPGEGTRVVFAPPIKQAREGTGHGHRLDGHDRTAIQIGLRRGLTPSQIAAEIGFHRSAVYREIDRHALHAKRGRERVKYSARIGQHKADQSRSRPKEGKLQPGARLRAEVAVRLNVGYSPEQIALRLPLEFPEDESMRISSETIYQALYVQGAGALRHELTVEKATRSGRTTRKPRSKLPARESRPWLHGARLADRDEKTIAEHAGRAVPGHWEGDLVVGPDNSGVITLAERASRFTLLGRLPGTRDSATVIDALTEMVGGLPAAAQRSITWDQGSEMAQHARFTIATNCPIYFCDPHSPWQRPTNENFNGQLRWEYPKGTNFNTISDDEIRGVQDMLNARPRKILEGMTPSERLDELLNVSH